MITETAQPCAETTHTYTKAGTYTVTLTATVSSECKATETESVSINPVLPTVASAKAEEITTTTAYTGGFVLEDGGAAIISRGVCWSHSPDPTLENNDGTIEDTTSGTGAFKLIITNLTPDTTYYVSAYAANIAGTEYGRDKSFRTLTPAIPGDLNDDGKADLQDAILALKVIAGIVPPENIRADADINGDNKIGFEEVIYILRHVLQR